MLPSLPYHGIFMCASAISQCTDQWGWDPSGYCHGMTESVKVHRKDQSVEDFISKCLFLLIWPILCVSLISLIEVWSFCTNLLENYYSCKIDHLLPLRILSLCKDQLFLLDCCMDHQLYLFLLFLFMPLALFWPEWCQDPCFSLSIVYSWLNQA